MKTLLLLLFISVLNFFAQSQSTNNHLEVNARTPQTNNNVVQNDSIIQRRRLITNDSINSSSNYSTLNSNYHVGEIKFVPRAPSHLNRKFVSKDIDFIQTNLPGIVTLNVCMNKNGLITLCEILMKESTITDMSIIKNVMKACKRFRFDSNPQAPAEDCGKIILNFSLKN